MNPLGKSSHRSVRARFRCPEELFDLVAKGHMEHFKKVKLALFYTKSAIVGSKTKNQKSGSLTYDGSSLAIDSRITKGMSIYE